MDKKATQQDLTNLFEEFGQIESINVSRSPSFVSLFSAANIKLEIWVLLIRHLDILIFYNLIELGEPIKAEARALLDRDLCCDACR